MISKNEVLHEYSLLQRSSQAADSSLQQAANSSLHMRSLVDNSKVSYPGPDPMYRTANKFMMPGTDGRYSITTQVQTNDPYKSPHNASNLRSVDTHVKEYDLSTTNRQPFPSIVEQPLKHQVSSELKKDSLFDEAAQTVAYSNEHSIQPTSVSV